MIGAISLLAVTSKLISGLFTGIFIHGSTLSGLEIWANTIARGEFSLALAVLYRSPVVGTTIAAMGIVTSIVGSFMAKYSGILRCGIVSRNRHKASQALADYEY